MNIGNEFVKWLLDISKYVITAIIISSFLTGLDEVWQVYTFGTLVAFACLLMGFLLSRYLNKKNKQKS